MIALRFGAALVDGSLLIQHAALAERHGFGFVAVGEHLMRHDPPGATLTALPALAAAAGATKHIGLLSSVAIAPLHRPVWLAKDAAVVDTISGGRLTLGLGVGGEFKREFELSGVPLRQRGARMDEALPLLRRLWSERDVAHHGRYFDVNGATLSPPPAQRGGPPIWIGGRSEAAVQRAGRLGDGWLPYLFTPEQYEESARAVRIALSSAVRIGDAGDVAPEADLASSPFAETEPGPPGRPFGWGLHLMATLGRTHEEARRTAGIAFSKSYRYGGDYEKLAERYMLLGRPDDCLETLRRFARAGARHILLAWQGPPEAVADQIAQSGEEILPRARHITD